MVESVPCRLDGTVAMDRLYGLSGWPSVYARCWKACSWLHAAALEAMESLHCCSPREALARATEGVEHGLETKLRRLLNTVNHIKSTPPFVLALWKDEQCLLPPVWSTQASARSRPSLLQPQFWKDSLGLWMKPVIYQLTHSIRDWHGNELVGIFAYTNNDCILIGQVYTNIANLSDEADSFIVLFV